MNLTTLFLSNGLNPSDRGFISQGSVSDDILFIEMNCAGTLITNAATCPIVDTGPGINFSKIILFAHYLNATNFCLLLPNLINTGINELELYGTSSNNIKAFLPSGTFFDGTNNVLLNNSQGKLIRNTPFGWSIR